MVFRLKFDSKSPQVFGTLLSILTVLNNVVVWMVSSQPLISKSSTPFNNPSATVPRKPITVSIIVTHCSIVFFNSLARSRYLFFFFHFLSILLCWSARDSKVHNFCKISFFVVVVVNYYKVLIRLAEIRWSVCMLINPIGVRFVSFSRTDAELCILLLSLLFLARFSQRFRWVVFYLSWSDSKVPQVFRILVDLNNPVVYMISIFYLTSNSANLFHKPLGTVPNAPTTVVRSSLPSCSTAFSALW